MRSAAKIEPGMDRREVSYTTYQMRNCFRQFFDGVASELDVHCYLQHAQAADLVPKGGRVLDVCCGRGLLLPFLRYRGNSPSLYVGVDAHPANARWKDGADPRREKEQKEGGWGFETKFVEATVDAMADKVIEAAGLQGPGDGFDAIVYTSAIEHMQPDAQARSLQECARLAGSHTTLYLSCPVTEPGRSGYDAQYAAHVYEPTLEELRRWLADSGWSVDRTVGLCTGAKHFRATLAGQDLRGAEGIYAAMPREFALVTIAALYPIAAKELALVCSRKGSGLDFGEPR